MYKLMIANKNTHMGKSAAPGIKEYEIAWFQIIHSDFVPDTAHCILAARQSQPYVILKNVVYQTAAIKAFFGGISAIAVTHPNLFQCIVHHIAGSLKFRTAGLPTAAFKNSVQSQRCGGQCIETDWGALPQWRKYPQKRL